MNVLEPKAYLGKPLQYLRLTEHAPTLLLNPVLKVSSYRKRVSVEFDFTISEVHDDAKFPILCLKYLNELDYVRVRKHL